MLRREFAGCLAAPLLAAAEPRYRVGITPNTRGGWEKDQFQAFREAREVGYRYMEAFIHSFTSYWDRPQDLQQKMDEIGVSFVTISNSGPLEMHFEDPARRAKLIDDHMRLVRFIKHFGCTHLKINLGGRRPGGTTEEDLANMAVTLDELGKRAAGEGIKLAPHAHMWSQLENGREIDAVLGRTDPRYVWFVLDTGHLTLAGIDPLALSQKLGHRIVEFHLKDVKPEHRGGARQRLERPDMMKDPPFFELGKGGVDFPGIKAHLDRIGWRGWLTVELDSSPFQPPKESARISKNYIEQVLKIKV
jgi:inosose dehydratase